MTNIAIQHDQVISYLPNFKMLMFDRYVRLNHPRGPRRRSHFPIGSFDPTVIWGHLCGHQIHVISYVSIKGLYQRFMLALKGQIIVHHFLKKTH